MVLISVRLRATPASSSCENTVKDGFRSVSSAGLAAHEERTHFDFLGFVPPSPCGYILPRQKPSTSLSSQSIGVPCNAAADGDRHVQRRRLLVGEDHVQ